ncbi:tetraspanin family protein [Dictyocaulus viviparus]|uniref:Tetraspanin family protein n=1 Tax=Dictyocaulus viviparus TaxID=29172 RepID=A0A0D8XE18_DICVI|nr:tetraspanin family protein [Dictyocaulus viviparus]
MSGTSCETTGVYCLVTGVWLYHERTDSSELTPLPFSALSTAGLCCSTGVAVCIICIVGWISAASYNRRLLLTYIAFVVLLALIQVVTVVLGFCYLVSAAREHVRRDLLNDINRTAVVAGQGAVFDLAASWDKLQKSLQCCGVDGMHDWYFSKRWPGKEFVPDSCCNPIYFSDVDSMKNCGKINNNAIIFKQLSSLALAIPIVRSESFITGSTSKSFRSCREEYHRFLVELSEIEGKYLRLHPMDRVRDAISIQNYLSFHSTTMIQIGENGS